MRRVALIAALVFAIDQITKIGVVQGLDLISRGEIDVIPPFLNFRMAWNQGVNFGLFASSAGVMRWVLILLSLVIVAWVWRWTARAPHGPWARASAGVLIGGALGNVVDRLVYGAVADFLNMSCCGYENPYAFNVADIAIFAGAAGLVLFTGSDARPPAKPRKSRGKTS
ncbi:signal peptidase II . Aspartic peptidase. MEROPS family A08 [Gemmobacter aquatilis]|uniref:Lipoprotein signal peptidase n=1 Tax=Gemmobacter aquatilis TaxID=933059 RepID=A0A1H7ZZ13_9RHOB|nr:signal peptidase II [Gemmobacter aquatilis]SEM62729.1 signal peptidase II . Aspartic peptidase. MEROPS family A08 [Gemmobacter aquatilis]